MKKFGSVFVLLFAFMLTACGGGGGGGSGGDSNVIVVPPSPSDSRTFENPEATDPLASFRAVQLPDSSKFDYQIETPSGSPLPDFTHYIAPDAQLQDDYLTMTHRAFKLWSRRIEEVIDAHPNHLHQEPGDDGVAQVHILSGYEQTDICGGRACANHYGDQDANPDRPNGHVIPVTMYTPEFFAITTTDDGQLTADGFRIIVHEFGHIFDHIGMPPDAEEPNHSDCQSSGSVGVMCNYWPGAPMVPTEQDFDGIRHHYKLKESSDHEVFGIWANVPDPVSNLNGFGVQVTRSLIVDGVLAPDRNQPMSSLLQDQILVETQIMGTSSEGPTEGMGTATWSGDLIAVDTHHFHPVLGEANLSMDLANSDILDASFTGMQRTDNAGMFHDVADTSYTLMKSGSTYLDEQGIIDANFYAVGTDNIGAVAGKLDDETRNLMGAFGALRD